MVLSTVYNAAESTLSSCHASIDIARWSLLVEQINERRPLARPRLFCPRYAALDIALDMAQIARKSGVIAYSYADFLEASAPVAGPYTREEEGSRGRSEILFELAALPFTETHQERGVKYLRLVL